MLQDLSILWTDLIDVSLLPFDVNDPKAIQYRSQLTFIKLLNESFIFNPTNITDIANVSSSLNISIVSTIIMKMNDQVTI